MAECFLHKNHGSAKPIILVTHHVVPLGMAGPDEAENKRQVCDTGHRNVHMIMGALVYGDPLPTGSRTEHALAREGYDKWVAMGEPGNKHASWALHKPEAA